MYDMCVECWGSLCVAFPGWESRTFLVLRVHACNRNLALLVIAILGWSR